MENKTDFFGRVYADIIRNPDIPPTAKALYAYFSVLCGAGDECFPSIATITAELNITESTFRKHLKILVANGAVTVSKSKDKRGCFVHNKYTLVPPAYKNSMLEKNHAGKSNFSADGKVKKPRAENSSTKDNLANKKGKEKPKSKFQNFNQRETDYEEIQNQLILKEYRENMEG